MRIKMEIGYSLTLKFLLTPTKELKNTIGLSLISFDENDKNKRP